MRKTTWAVLMLTIFVGLTLLRDSDSVEADWKFQGPITLTEKTYEKVDAQAAILLDSQTGEIMYEQNADTPYPVASMSKMMTEYMLLEAIKEERVDWDDQIVVSENAAATGGSRVHLVAGEAYPIKDLYEAMAIGSANNAAVAIGEYLAGSTSAFAEQMNLKAAELNLRSSSFVNATGLDTGYGQNEMTTRDVGMLAYHLLNDFPDVVKWTGELSNTNNLKLDGENADWSIAGLDGLKTGYTNAAGYYFTATAKRGDKRLISVVMGAEGDATRFTETKKLMERGFDNG
ncbi:D-alanyl-D-alanine carboxypeptidase family protein [Brevibacillus sp. DP1.3A]|uniref:D-alanyl-D-alanine carboxypeptidase family protein n=1 Tax=Brevibacillus sp. DP1.3A TaxID=2738867 RepID=UPI00156B0A24|nr:D-alanyl-D-alanine carboxypeptidase family protein [Brevibacillus sp. DP1.3A]MED1916596.1 D-alanyl-D-alanine carboxypeptidase [Bacillus thuringiensis]UED75294.1 D-alanyl-D-alanine carboxypeptidase [Brevibacillus sp. DP1.3A]